MTTVRAEVPASALESTSIAKPARAWMAVAAIAAGVGLDVVYRVGPPTLAGAALVALAAAVLVGSRRLENPQAVALVTLAPLFGLWLVLRWSGWLLPLDILSAGALLALGTSLARGGSVLDLSVPSIATRATYFIVNCILAPGFLATARRRRETAGPGVAILRGVALAVPLLVVLGLLLASADAVFASAFRIDAKTVLLHPIVVAFGAWGMAGLLRVSSVNPPEQLDVTGPRLGRTEWTTILVGIDLLFAGFAAARIIALSQGGRRVIATAGLTYAEYARSGFFQLLAAAAITLIALLSLRAVAGGGRRFVVLAEIAIGLTLVVVVSAFQRLVLYERAFGLTMLRLAAMSFCLWLAAALVALGVWIASGARKHWYLAACGAVALALLLVLQMVNAEALIVRRNVDHAQRNGKFDPAYLSELGDDAVPALVASLPRLHGAHRAEVLARLCETKEDVTSGLAFNSSRNAAVRARARVCAKEER